MLNTISKAERKIKLVNHSVGEINRDNDNGSIAILDLLFMTQLAHMKLAERLFNLLIALYYQLKLKTAKGA